MAYNGPVTSNPKYKLFIVRPTVESGTDYAAGDVLFAPTEIQNVFAEAGESARIESITIFCKGTTQDPALILYFTNSSTAFGTINATADAAVGVLEEIQMICPVVAADYEAGSYRTDNAGFALGNQLTLPYGVITGNNWAGTNKTTGIHVTAIATDTINFASTTDLIIRVGVEY